MSYILGAGVFVLLFFFVVLILTYVWVAMALMTMATKQKIENAWLAWVPIANLYILGLLIKKYVLFGNTYDNPEILLPAAALIGFVAGRIPLLGGLLGLLITVFQLIGYYQLVEKYKKGSGAITTILLVFLPPIGAYLLYGMKDNTPVDIE